MIIILLIFAAVGAAAGLLAGLLGIGGGLIMVPALLLGLPALGVAPTVVTQMAVGTSLACISIISINSARAHHARGSVDWKLVLRLVPGLVIGALAGAWLAHFLPALILKRVIGVAALLVAVRMFFGSQPKPGRGTPGRVGLSGAGSVIGALSSLVGIGGGSLTVPFLVWCNVPMVRAVSVSAACGIPIAWAGVAGFIWTGLGLDGRGEAALGYVSVYPALAIIAASLIFTPMGAALAHRLPTRALKMIFAVLLLAVGINLLFF